MVRILKVRPQAAEIIEFDERNERKVLGHQWFVRGTMD